MITIKRYNPNDAAAWDAFVGREMAASKISTCDNKDIGI